MVAEIGDEVSGFEFGDRVVLHLFFSCDRCYFCRVGRHQQCVDLKGILGVLCNGAFAEYFKAPPPTSLNSQQKSPLTRAAWLGRCGNGSACCEARESSVGASALVYGAGDIGRS